MSERIKRLRRTQLAVPASDPVKMAKAAASAADFVFLDLEDAVAPRAKPEARGKAVQALQTLDWGRKTRCVRVNDLSTPYWLDDVIEVITGARDALDVLMLPKVMRASDVAVFDAVVTQLEHKLGLSKRIGFDVLIEEVEALQNVEEIAKASSRVEALILGLGDYSASQGIDVYAAMTPPGYPGDLFHYPRCRVAGAARAAGIVAVDGPYANFKDEAGFREECRRARILGFTGKWAIHPAQVAPALVSFTPEKQTVAMARRLTAAYQESEARGEGAVVLDGVMADAATVRLLRNTLDKADLIGM